MGLIYFDLTFKAMLYMQTKKHTVSQRRLLDGMKCTSNLMTVY